MGAIRTHKSNFTSRSIRRSVSAGEWVKSAPGGDARRAKPRTTQNLKFTCQQRHTTNMRLKVRRAGAPTAGGPANLVRTAPWLQTLWSKPSVKLAGLTQDFDTDKVAKITQQATAIATAMLLSRGTSLWGTPLAPKQTNYKHVVTAMRDALTPHSFPDTSSARTSEERAPCSLLSLAKGYKSWICTVPSVASLGLAHHVLHLLLGSRSSNGFRRTRQPSS